MEKSREQITAEYDAALADIYRKARVIADMIVAGTPLEHLAPELDAYRLAQAHHATKLEELDAMIARNADAG